MRRASGNGEGEQQYEIVGPVCESSDVVGRDRRLPRLTVGNLVAVRDVGAYGSAMASNYNRRPLPAEVLGKDLSAGADVSAKRFFGFAVNGGQPLDVDWTGGAAPGVPVLRQVEPPTLPTGSITTCNRSPALVCDRPPMC